MSTYTNMRMLMCILNLRFVEIVGHLHLLLAFDDLKKDTNGQIEKLRLAKMNEGKGQSAKRQSAMELKDSMLNELDGVAENEARSASQSSTLIVQTERSHTSIVTSALTQDEDLVDNDDADAEPIASPTLITQSRIQFLGQSIVMCNTVRDYTGETTNAKANTYTND
jgi:hypothetical protein